MLNNYKIETSAWHSQISLSLYGRALKQLCKFLCSPILFWSEIKSLNNFKKTKNYHFKVINVKNYFLLYKTQNYH